MIKVHVGIPTYNGANRVEWLLNSIYLKCSDEDRKILENSKIVVCDDSGKVEHQEKTRNVVNKWKSHLPVELIVNEKNMGVATTWNILTRSDVSPKYIILINDDVIVAKHWLENMVYFLDNNSNVGTVGQACHVINEEDVSQLLSSPDAFVSIRHPISREQVSDFDPDYDPAAVPERCMAAVGNFFGFKREVYNKVGGFDENFYAFYEESDFGTAVASHGYPSYILQCPRNWHIWSATFGHAPEISPGLVMQTSREYYTKKWNGHCEITHPKYMSKIPFQKVKWICKGKEYEELVRGMFGY